MKFFAYPGYIIRTPLTPGTSKVHSVETCTKTDASATRGMYRHRRKWESGLEAPGDMRSRFCSLHQKISSLMISFYPGWGKDIAAAERKNSEKSARLST